MHHATPTPDTYLAKTPTRARRFRSFENCANPVVLVLVGTAMTLVGVLAMVAL